MKKIIITIPLIILTLILLFTLLSCSKEDRSCNVSYNLTDTVTGEDVTNIVVGHSYYLHIQYEIDDQNSKDYSFVSYINANDNLLANYHGGSTSNCTINGNLIEVAYSGKDATVLTAKYKIEAKSKGTSYLRFKDQENIFFSNAEIALEVQEAE